MINTDELRLEFSENAEHFDSLMVKMLAEVERLQNLLASRLNKAPTPWEDLASDGWMIVGMNHYLMHGERHMFCSMAKEGRCIVAEGTNEQDVFDSLREQARAV